MKGHYSAIPSEWQTRLNRLRNETVAFISLYWRRALFLGLTVFILLKKDVDIAVQMEGRPHEGGALPAISQVKEGMRAFLAGAEPGEPVWEVSLDAPAEPEAQPLNTSILNGKPGKSSWWASLWEKEETPVENDNRANTMSNLTFSGGEGLSGRRAEKRRKQLAYVNQFAEVALREKQKYGIPASITLAQGLLESDAGESRLSQKNNNHFGIKCFSKSCRKGHCRNFTDDHHKDFFRIYKNAWESYRAHSILLQSKRYRSLKRLDPTDYRNWARGLQEAGYATDKKYAEKLVFLIEDLKLYEYDH